MFLVETVRVTGYNLFVEKFSNKNSSADLKVYGQNNPGYTWYDVSVDPL
jgi:hypothetical protein